MLTKLFHRVCIPVAVQEELLKFHDELPEWLEVIPVEDHTLVSAFAKKLDRGESEAIALALQTNPDRLLIDERKGRLIASSQGIPIIGLVGLVILARRKGVIDSVTRILGDLETVAGFYLHPEVKRQALDAAGELN